MAQARPAIVTEGGRVELELALQVASAASGLPERVFFTACVARTQKRRAGSRSTETPPGVRAAGGPELLP